MIVRILLLALVCAGMASAQRVPRGTFAGKEFDAAVAEAQADDKPIAVVLTEIESSCPKCYSATETAFKKMRSKFVLVLADQRVNKNTGGLPAEVNRKTYEIYKTKGNTTPIITVFSPDGKTVLGGACYDQIAGDERQWLRDLEAEIEKAALATVKEEDESTGSAGAESEAGATAMKSWTDVRGREMVAELLGSDGIKATFKLASGKVVEIPLGRLSDESRARVDEAS